MKEDDQEVLRTLVKEINEIRGNSKLKKAWKASVADLKPKKETKKRKAPVAEKVDPTLSVAEEMKGTAKEAMGILLEACRKNNVPLPRDEVLAKQRLAGYLTGASPEGRSSCLWKLRDAFRDVLKELAPHALKKQKTGGEFVAKVAANQKLVDAFKEIGVALMKVNRFKGSARIKAAKAIAELDFEVFDGIPLSKGKTKVPGIGKASAADINTILETGTCDSLEDIRAG